VTTSTPTSPTAGAPPTTGPGATPIAPRTGNGPHSAVGDEPLALLLAGVMLIIAGGSLLARGRRK
jgi:LPXTG-motif cell wall-anchored protein